MKEKFCNDYPDVLERLTQLIFDNLMHDIDGKTLLTARYTEMRKNYGVETKLWERNILYEYARFNDMQISVNNLSDKSLLSTSNIGIDLPVWFNWQATTTKIMLVGMEPFRKNKPDGYATVSSPFGLHCFNNNKNPSRRLIENLLEI